MKSLLTLAGVVDGIRIFLIIVLSGHRYQLSKDALHPEKKNPMSEMDFKKSTDLDFPRYATPTLKK
jgi:hypothetical protein